MSFQTSFEKASIFMGKPIIVMEKTIRELTSFKRLAVVIIVGLLPALLFGGAVWRETFRSGAMSLEMQTHTIVGYFLVFSFRRFCGHYSVLSFSMCLTLFSICFLDAMSFLCQSAPPLIAFAPSRETSLAL